MDEFEQQLRASLRTAVANRPRITPVDPGEVMATPSNARRGRRWTRWVPLAAALALVAGIGVAVLVGRPDAVPAVPAATPSGQPTPTPTAPATGATGSLVGTRWSARTINGSRVLSTTAGDVPYLAFVTDSSAVGGDPCNRLTSTYTLDGSTLRFAGWSATEIACGSHVVVAQQGTYLAALGSIETLTLVASRLELRDATGRLRLEFDRSEEPSPTASPTARDIRLRLSNQSPWDFTSAGISDLALGPLPRQAITTYVVYTEDPNLMAVHLVGARGVWGLRVTLPDGGTLPPGNYTLTIRDIGGRPDAFLSDRPRIFAPDPNDPENQVHDYPQVRLRNDTTSTIEYVSIGWPGGGRMTLADLQPGEYTEYAELGAVRLGAEVTVVVDGKRLTFTPKAAGAKLTSGNATYVLRVVDGALDVTTEIQR